MSPPFSSWDPQTPHPQGLCRLQAQAPAEVVSFEFQDFPSCYEVNVLSGVPEKIDGLPSSQRWSLWGLWWASRPHLGKNRTKLSQVGFPGNRLGDGDLHMGGLLGEVTGGEEGRGRSWAAGHHNRGLGQSREERRCWDSLQGRSRIEARRPDLYIPRGPIIACGLPWRRRVTLGYPQRG